MHGLTVYAKEGLPSHGTYLQKTLQILTNIFDWLYFTQYLTSFSSINHLLCLCTGIFDSSSCNPDEVIWINPSANEFVFGDFNVQHKEWLNYSGATDRSGELCYNFFISNDLNQMVNFPTRISDCNSHSVLLFWIYLFLLTIVFILEWLSLHWEILIILFSQFPFTFHQIHNEMTCFIPQHMTILVLIGMVYVII